MSVELALWMFPDRGRPVSRNGGGARELHAGDFDSGAGGSRLIRRLENLA